LKQSGRWDLAGKQIPHRPIFTGAEASQWNAQVGFYANGNDALVCHRPLFEPLGGNDAAGLAPALLPNVTFCPARLSFAPGLITFNPSGQSGDTL
jgi:hypothetical protein